MFCRVARVRCSRRLEEKEGERKEDGVSSENVITDWLATDETI